MAIQAQQVFCRGIRFFVLVLLVFVLPVVAQNSHRAAGRGDAHAGKGDWSKAIAEYRRAVAADPDEVEYRAKLGRALGKAANVKEALVELLEGLRLDPGASVVYRSLGECYLDMGHWSSSEAAYRNAVKLSAADAQAQYGLGIALSAQEKFDDAAGAFSRAVALAPENAEYVYGLGKVQVRQKKWKEAEANLRLAMKKSSESSFELICVNALGNLFGAQGRWADAEQEFRKAVKLDAKDGRSLANLALSLYRRGLRQEAWAAASGAVRLGYKGPHAVYSEMGIVPVPVLAETPLISERPGTDAMDSKLLAAISAQDAAAAKAALAAGADPDAMDGGRRAIEIAAANGDAATVKTLVNYGADVDAAGQADAPLILAIGSESIDTVLTLLAAGVDTECGPKGSAILAAMQGQADGASGLIVDVLVKVGAKVNVRIPETGMTPLMWAAGAGSMELVKLLADAGADASTVDMSGKTAADYARQKGNSDAVDFLVAYASSKAPPAPANAIRLSPGGDLLAASRNARSGQTIVLSAGKYYGPIYVTDKKLTIVGDAGGASVIAPQPDGKPRLIRNGDPYIYVAKGGSLDLWNLRFEESPASDPAIAVQGADVLRLRYCSFENISKTVCIAQQTDLLVSDCRFENLTGNGVLVVSDSTCTVRDSEFSNVSGTCIQAGRGSKLSVAGSTFTGAKMGVSAFERSVMRISDCEFTQTERGVQAGDMEFLTLSDSEFSECMPVLVNKSDGTVIRRNRIENSKIGDKSTGVYIENSRGMIVADNRIEGFVSSVAVKDSTKEPAAIARNIVRRTQRGFVLSGESGGEGPAVFISRNRVLGLPYVSETDLYAILADGELGMVLCGNTILPGSSGSGVVLQNGATGRFVGNLLSTTDEAIYFHKTASPKSTLLRELIVDGLVKTYQSGSGPVVGDDTERLDTFAKWSPRCGLLRRVIFDQPRSADVSDDQLATFLSRVDAECKAARAEVGEYGTVRLEVRDRLGAGGTVPFKTFDRQSPISGFTNFTLDQVIDPERLVDKWKIKEPASIKDPFERAMVQYESSDKVLTYLRQNAHATTRRLVDACKEGAPPSEMAVLAIVMELNRFLECEEFVGTAQNQEVASLAALHRCWLEWKQVHDENISAEQKKTRIRNFNRKMLDDVFKFGVAQSGPILLTKSAPALPGGRYVIESGSSTGITTDVAFAPGLDVTARAVVNDGLWLTYGAYDGKKRDILRLRSGYEMQRAIGKLRFAWDRPGFAMRKAEADAASVKKALDIARQTLTANENKRSYNDFYLAMRIFSAVGEMDDCRRIVESSRKVAGGANAWTFKDKLACAAVIGRIDAANSRLENGTLSSLLKNSDRDWAIAAAVELHRNGLDTGDDLLRAELAGGDGFSRVTAAGLVLLDSSDLRTLEAMRKLWDRMIKDKDLNVRGEVEENASIAPMLYLLAYGQRQDWRRVSRFTLWSKHVEQLLLLAKNPETLMRRLAENANLGFGMDDSGFYRLGEVFFDYPYARFRELISEFDRQTSSVIFENKPQTPRSSPYNTSRVCMSPFLPNSVAAAAYAGVGRWDPMNASPWPMLTWWKNDNFLTGYVSRWINGNNAYQDQLSYFSADQIEQELNKQGQGKKPPNYELFMAYLSVATREYTHPYMRSEGYESRPYLARHEGDSGLSGMANLRFDWKDDALQVGVRLFQDRAISGGFLADPENRRAHYPFIIDGGRKMIQSVTLRRGDRKVQAKPVEAPEGESFFLFEGDPKVTNKDLSGWYVDVAIKYVNQDFTLTSPLFFGENARRLRVEGRLQNREGK